MADLQRKTANLFNTFDIIGQVPSISNGELVSYNGVTTSLIAIPNGNVSVTKTYGVLVYILLYAADQSYIGYTANENNTEIHGYFVPNYENARYCRIRMDGNTYIGEQIMLVEGPTAKPYEPYGWVSSIKIYDGITWQSATVKEWDGNDWT